MFQITEIATEDFPRGPGSRFKSSEEFYELVNKIISLKDFKAVKVSLPEARSKTAACTLRDAIHRELKKRRMNGGYEVVTRRDDSGFYQMYARKITKEKTK